ncbi:zinc finger protein 677-like isoform X3 [Rhopilema esculentum]|uniref:zinc finger protein 677-like isoform X3 n=1 Tax=Rhopilema esculentum TaxID=499914 RepID=UPI0031E3D99B
MAAADVIIVDTSAHLQYQKGTERIERVLESWCKDLRVKVVNEFIKYKSSLENEQQRTLSEIQSKPSPEVLKLRREIDKLRELLHTLEKSVSQKDELVSNLVKSLEKEKEKYEKLRAVSTDQWERSSAEKSDENTAAAEKQYNNRLVSRCWKAWKEAARSKDFSDDVANENAPRIVEVKQEECLPAEESPFSDDTLEGSDEDIEQFIKSSTTLDYGASAAPDERTYPAYQTTVSKSYNPTDTDSPGQDETASFSVLQRTQEDSENITKDEEIVDGYPVQETKKDHQGASVSRIPPTTGGPTANKVRGKKRAYARTAYERGKKMYEIKDKIRIKKVQSLKGRTSFLNSDGRPTMATNAFQKQMEENEGTLLQVTSTAQTSSHLTHNKSYDPHDFTGGILQSKEPIADTSANVEHVQPPFGPNRSDWETAKNNISQYMNQMLKKGADTKEANRNPIENRTILATTSGIGETLKEDSDVSGSANQTTEPENQAKAGGEGHQCSLCAHDFASQEVLQKHYRMCPAKPKDAPKWVCKECGKSFVSGRRYLQDHIMMVHKGMPPYRCDVCLKGFTTLANFKSHILLHGTERPFNCRECNRGFAQKGNFLRHLKGVHGMQITFKSRKR